MHVDDPPTLRCLGDPSLFVPGPDGEAALLDLGKPLALITYLACTPGHTAGREHLVDLLWSDLDRDPGRHGLRQALWHIRKRLGDGFVVAERESVTLIGALRFDRDEFIAAAERGDLECVAARYSGEFFPGFATPGSGEFERWAELERARLRSVFIQCVERLARLRLHEGRAREAIDLAKRARDVEPLRRASWNLLLEALIAASDTLGAAVEADALERLLVEEEIELDSATRALLKQARQSSQTIDGATSAPAAMVAELVGREREFAALLDAWNGVLAARPLASRVVAPAGLGKSRLLLGVVARLRSMRARPIYVRANAGAHDVPYSLASDVASLLAELPGARAISPSAARALVSLDPRLEKHYDASAAQPSSSIDALRHRMLAIRELMAAVADEHPLALFVDDLHWADAASRQLLTGAFGGLQHEPVLFVVAERSRSVTDASLPNAALVPIDPLSPSAVTALVTSLAALPAESWADRLPDALHRASGGSPLLVLETLHLAIQRGLLVRDENGWNAHDPNALLRMLDEGGAMRHRIERLSEIEMNLLSLLACAGAPLDPETLSAAGEVTSEAVDAQLLQLESIGLVARNGERWEVAHDEISTRVQEHLPDGERQRRNAAIGRALLPRSHEDPQRVRFAAHQARAGDDRVTLAAVFDRFIRDARRRGDRRRTISLAHDLLGESSSPGEAAALVSSLPVSVRLGLVTPRRIAAAVASSILLPVGLTMAVVALRKPALPPPDAVLSVMVRDRSGLSIFEARIDSAGWTPSVPIVVKARGRPRWRYAGNGFTELAPRPGHPGSWAAAAPVADSGALELFLLSPERGTERLTLARGLDIHPSWSPDGSRLVFSTGRWNDLEHYDIATFDVANRTVTQLTSGDATDDAPHWSPDGTRIAFRRLHWDGSSSQLCVIAANRTRLRCHTQANRDATPRGWLDESAVLLALGSNTFARLDVDAWANSDPSVAPANLELSPNGGWVESHADTSAVKGWRIYPAREPSAGRPVEIDTPERAGLFVTWGSTAASQRFLHRLQLNAGPGHPRVGVAYSLSADGFDATGSTVVPRELTFRSSDSTIATVDSLGVLRPRRPGAVVIDASAGGWRTAQLRLSIEANRVDTLLKEAWASGIGDEWVSFGDPLPGVDIGPEDLRGLNNRGDGRFTSGVHARRGFAVQEGLGIDVTFSTPITRAQWQLQEIGFVFGLDSATLFSWDHRTSDPWSFVSVPVAGFCIFKYPGGPEGPAFADSLVLSEVGARAFPAPRYLRSGEWYRVRLQLFPDGRCGVALNGTPLLIGAAVVPARPAYLFFQGMSVRTKMLVGPLSVFSGVRTDVDWEVLRR